MLGVELLEGTARCAVHQGQRDDDGRDDGGLPGEDDGHIELQEKLADGAAAAEGQQQEKADDRRRQDERQRNNGIGQPLETPHARDGQSQANAEKERDHRRHHSCLYCEEERCVFHYFTSKPYFAKRSLFLSFETKARKSFAVSRCFVSLRTAAG